MTEELIREARDYALALHSSVHVRHTGAELIEKICNALEATAGAAVSGSTSDGHHTFDELYDYRMLYNVHAAHGWFAAGIPVVKSWKHSGGELCFGGGWFIVTATLPTGQVSNHYKAEHWGLFAVPEVALPPDYDGHTPQDAAERLRAAAVPVEPVRIPDRLEVDEAKREFRFTNEQWREYQQIPEQGYSHRRWIEHRVNEWLRGGGR